MKALELKKACENNRFIIARSHNGTKQGINCLIAKIALKRKSVEDNLETTFESYCPASFHEYLTFKIPFYSPNK